ncbi:hypothetical protein [Dokdonella soli]|uniref:Uncharacterized protein n=1 Tax=Dokdonella soli TaxID=529810 RepID=A0ABN1IC64_9GAMM
MLSLSALAFSLLVAAPAPVPHSNLVIAPCDAGEHQQFEVITCDIELKNTGDKPIHVSKGEAAMAWDSIETGVITVPAHGVAYIKAKASLRDNAGYVKHSFRFATDEPGILAVRGSNVNAFVSTVLDDSAPTIDFGMVKLDGPLPSKSITLASREVNDFRILEILSKPDYLDASLGPDGRTVHATLRKDAPWGQLHDKIKLKINAPQQPEAWISVDANAQGEVVPDGDPFSLGLMRTNNKNEFLVRMTSRSGKDFKVGAVTLERLKGKADVVPCVPAESGCKLVRLRVTNDQALGRLQGVLNVELPDFKRTLPIEVVGMLLSPEVKVHDFNEEVEKAREAKGAAQSVAASPTQPKGIDITQAIKQTVNKEADVPPPGKGPLLRWSVANEGSIYGYIVYRADAETGPFLRINKEMIRVIDDGGNAAGSYQWRDNSAESGKVYWYSIGMVKGNGEKQPLTGAQKIIAK